MIMTMNNSGILNKMIQEIKNVGLHAAYVSIEEDRIQNLLNYCHSNNITCSLVDESKWPCHKESYYIGDESEPKNLQLFSLNF